MLSSTCAGKHLERLSSSKITECLSPVPMKGKFTSERSVDNHSSSERAVRLTVAPLSLIGQAILCSTRCMARFFDVEQIFFYSWIVSIYEMRLSRLCVSTLCSSSNTSRQTSSWMRMAHAGGTEDERDQNLVHLFHFIL